MEINQYIIQYRVPNQKGVREEAPPLLTDGTTRLLNKELDGAMARVDELRAEGKLAWVLALGSMVVY